MPALGRRAWVPAHCEDLVQSIATQASGSDPAAVSAEIDRLVALNRRIHERD